MLSAINFFDFSNNNFKKLFDNTEYVWEALNNIKIFLKQNLVPNISAVIKKGTKTGIVLNKTIVLYKNKAISKNFIIQETDAVKEKLIVKIDNEIIEGASVIYEGAIIFDDEIYLGKGTVIEPGALIKGPTYIGNNTEIRQGAYIRGNVIIGDKCVVGHTTEMKSSVMLGDSKAGHFAYIGDSILGKVNLGAGTKLANLKLDNSIISIKIEDKIYNTNLKKFGAILGDGVETGCNTVTTPGTILSKNVFVYPNTTVRGYCISNTIIKQDGIKTPYQKK